MTIYEGFDQLPPVDQLQDGSNIGTDGNVLPQDEVHTGGRTWKWDGVKWTLYSDSEIDGYKFTAETPVENEVTTQDGENIIVKHYFDLHDLPKLESP